MPYNQWETAHWVVSHLSKPLKFREEWLEYSNHWTAISQMEVLTKIADTISLEIAALNERIKHSDSESLKSVWIEQIKYFKSLLRAPILRDIMFLMQSICLDAENWDEVDGLFPANNTIIQLETGVNVPLNKEFKISRYSRVDFDRTKIAYRWKQFIKEITGDDQELMDYLQRAVGYSLGGGGSEQALFILFGPGANGKNVFLELLYEIFGTMAHQTNFGILEKAYRGDDAPGRASPHLAAFMGKRFIMASESAEGSSFNDGIVKSLTGDAHITARRLYSEEVVFKNKAKIWVSCNNIPKVSDVTPGFWRRLHIVPFNVTFGEGKRDLNLKEKLFSELPGILNWAIEGAIQWNTLVKQDPTKGGLRPPKLIIEAVAKYRADSDPLGGFFDERCVIHPKVAEGKKALYDAYRRYCKADGNEPLANNKFVRLIEAKGFTSTRRQDKRVFSGLCLNEHLAEFPITSEDVEGEKDDSFEIRRIEAPAASNRRSDGYSERAD